ncbi:CDP-glycerol glycerophosphotransferase family protein [Gelidibacter salicanalis]|uniref:CDP-glycerol glycerophosphotransferase family protein n=1 Tax=Gelidibacter salicanalis TaxID=291193 RepID=A0A934NHV4_9FLAO|nr:CDP-glycerol glycerophosphotransferase family protein [Gelidibacter salicanalis]MBJ7879344.1 CDP-glycerol glycerophosphotransferase family protein [Gelidibacter salicanalis]
MAYKFLIYISYSYAVPVGIPLEEEIINRGHTIKWFSDLENGKQSLKGKSNLLNTIEDVVAYKPEIVLGATDDVPDFITGLKVQIFHGFFAKKRPLKNGEFYHFRIRGFFDLYCTQGPSTTNVFTKLSKELKYFEVIETGWSKADPMFPLEKSSDSTPSKTDQRPTIMIASTFTERLSLAYNDAVFNEIKRLSNSNTYKFIMVLHPKLPLHIIEKWQFLTNANFNFFNTTDLIPLFLKADILFADTTSAIQEFVLQKKPVVTFKHRVHEDFLIDIDDPQEIETAFSTALNPSEDLLERIDTYIENLHPYVDGKSSKRVIDACISFLHKDRSYLNNKPFNLIRKYKIRKRLAYFTLKSYNEQYAIERQEHE